MTLMQQFLRIWSLICIAIFMTRADPSPKVLSPEFTAPSSADGGKRLGQSVRGGSHPTMVLAGRANPRRDSPSEVRVFPKKQAPIFPWVRKTTPPPDLDRIRQNTDRMIKYLDACAAYASQVPLEVYLAFQIPTPTDAKQGLASALFSSCFELISEVPIPGSGILSWFLSGLQEAYSDPKTEPASLAAPMVDILARFDANMLQMRLDLSIIHQDPQSHLYDTYQIPWGNKRTIQVWELGVMDFPDQNEPDFTRLIEVFVKAWRKSLSKNLLPMRYQIATIHYKVELEQSGDPTLFIRVRRCWPENPKDSDANVPHSWSGGDVEISLCGPLSGHRPIQSNVHGDGVNTRQAFLDTIAKIVSDHPEACYLYDEIWERSAPDLNWGWKGATYWSCWLVPAGSYGNQSFTLAPVDFVHWLFIDDGAGNVVNPNGVAYRKEVFTSWGLEGTEGVRIPKHRGP
jgi:hypothetical protein